MIKKFCFLFCVYFIISYRIVFPQFPSSPMTVAEYNPTESVLITWAHNPTSQVNQIFILMIREIKTETKIFFLVNNISHKNWIKSMLQSNNIDSVNTDYVTIPNSRIWIRDHGPFSIIDNGNLAFVDYINYAYSPVDDSIPTRLANIWSLSSYRPGIIFDGGNFLMDNYGTLFTTKKVFTDNPQYTQSQITQIFNNYNGANRHIVLKRQHNDYWGHIDMQVKLLNDTTIIMSTCDAGLPNYDSLTANFNILSSVNAYNGFPYHIEKIPMAANSKTYINSLIVNNKVLVPVYADIRDSFALSTYQRLLPGKEIIGINCNNIIGWDGAIHCITMQIPVISITNIKNYSESAEYKLGYNYPNPFNNSTLINYTLPFSANVRIQIFDINGKIISTLVNSCHSSGTYNISFRPEYLPSGIYFYTMNINDQIIQTRKMSYIK